MYILGGLFFNHFARALERPERFITIAIVGFFFFCEKSINIEIWFFEKGVKTTSGNKTKLECWMICRAHYTVIIWCHFQAFFTRALTLSSRDCFFAFLSICQQCLIFNLHLKIWKKLSTNSTRGSNSVVVNYWNDPSEYFCPNSFSLSAIYDSLKSKVWKVVESENDKVSFS